MAYNSTIKQKVGECPDCGDKRIKPLITGKCSYHYEKHRRFIRAQRKKQREKIKHKPAIDNTGNELGGNITTVKWFKEKTTLIDRNPYCSECGEFIPEVVRLHAVAHIFPKSPNSGFPSVATHPLNFLILGAGCGCHNKTHRLDTFSKMKVWPIAVERFLIFKDQITEKHKYFDEFLNLIQ